MNYQFMFNGRQDFEKKISNLNIDIDLVGMGGGETIKNDFLVASTEILFLPFMKNNNYD